MTDYGDKITELLSPHAWEREKRFRSLHRAVIAAFVVGIFALLLALAAHGTTLPDKTKTPGLTVHLTKAQICSTKWQRARGERDAGERRVTAAMKRRVFLAYGISCAPTVKKGGPPRCSDWEIDHLVPRSLGGADDEKNLFPQPMRGQWNALMKDRLERRLHVEVCSGRVKLEDAQRLIAKDWTALYTRYFIDDGK